MGLTLNQINHIKLIKEVLNIIPDNYVLKGGTALLLDYRLNRFSEDIDLDYLINNKQQNNLKNSLIKFCNQNKYQYYIKKDTESVLRFIIKYENKTLKIESSSRDIVSENDYHQSLNGNYNVYSLNSLAQKKLDAFLNRDKFRDFYDINFLLTQNIFNNNQIKQIEERFNNKSEEMFFRELNADTILKDNVDFDNFILNFIENLDQNKHKNKLRSIKK
ncbi:hypothetical protein E1I18_00740 [Mycoplasmopsis mucosicanis]|uniref:Nucleotidyl transferase AbiEii/AbiGii toxin family protein n=1 Tax=Mycoplasmopsis mucosicanis TaxID=458208 RepID=A0A507SQQ0_9BACT|nr:nucleotidyl transferase AbiEii/AbiGii toxin family protein [Mycoplasmopsis mucosicanis]TQC54117.1 hypothetical protein E1I18_00740 [Mycoplasmopsis mucosicanis]